MKANKTLQSLNEDSLIAQSALKAAQQQQILVLFVDEVLFGI